ncbi:hypothetical protein [Pseudomonas fluorescens]|uniref:Heme utilization protein n=1 Tax=Pseudomonas fluorescens TaxID=294 RepID=A0A5E7BCF4_PSEFL|nr:hypothetical protein [Pseudomonas fluorescens]VVN83143.1 hypothetical protein PS710_01270 [Pseudomonas fluorescens]
MKTKLFPALILAVLAANTYAADGYDKTGSAAFTAQAHTPAERARSGSYAADDSAETGKAEASDG